MTNTLKPILLKIARLPSVDQRWILKHLPEEQKEKFTQHEGISLLKRAKQYRLLTPQHVNSITKAPTLPACASLLANKTALYAAIVIEQGNFPWKEAFLAQYDKEGLIIKQLEQGVHDIKPKSKQALFDDWQTNLAFDELMEHGHG